MTWENPLQNRAVFPLQKHVITFRSLLHDIRYLLWSCYNKIMDKKDGRKTNTETNTEKLLHKSEAATFTVDGKNVALKADQQMKNEREQTKTRLKEQLANGEIDGVKYNQEMIKLNVPDEYIPQHKNRKTVLMTRIAIISILIAIIIPIIWLAAVIGWRYYFQNSLTTAGVPDYSDRYRSSIEEDPIQITLNGYSEEGEYKGRPINITYKAYYDITGLVVSTHDYWGFGAYDTLVPRDICMVWGSLATLYPDSAVEYHQPERACDYQINDFGKLDPSSYHSFRGALGNHGTSLELVSNNHLIPSSTEVRDEFLSINVGDTVRLVGYLVRVEYDGILLDSSVTRDDDSLDRYSGTCELIYVTGVEKVDSRTD